MIKDERHVVREPLGMAAWLRCVAGSVVALLLAGSATVPSNVPRLPSYAPAVVTDTPLARAYADDMRAHPELSGLQLLTDGHAAFVSRSALSDVTVRTLDLQY